jgi:hypothetical protein
VDLRGELVSDLVLKLTGRQLDMLIIDDLINDWISGIRFDGIVPEYCSIFTAVLHETIKTTKAVA